MAPGKRTSGRGKRGSSTRSSDLEGLLALLWCFSEKEEDEHLKEVSLENRRLVVRR